MSTSPVPRGYHTVTPYLAVRGASALIDFVVKGLGGEVLQRTDTPDGRVGNAELRVGDSMLMVADARDEASARPPMLYLYVPDVDALYRRALAAGGTSLREPADQFYGDRVGAVTDASGTQWWMATHVEDVSDDELARRFAAAKK